ncbi:2209_t:CDS:2 [Scutellospora calospora]|uniref:2209_t:CDS:1 n=1 Tax=Scutellospora calospora TaxID=85575 RepID=A0ACA9K3C4_9GLOM|nr:2209_t:CDS:2 [Scutellospora calospora]
MKKITTTHESSLDSITQNSDDELAYQNIKPEQNELDDQDKLDEENNSREGTKTNILDTITWKSRLQE